MEWLFALIAVTTTPLWMILWWIPRCDAIGMQKAKAGSAHKPSPATLVGKAA